VLKLNMIALEWVLKQLQLEYTITCKSRALPASYLIQKSVNKSILCQIFILPWISFRISNLADLTIKLARNNLFLTIPKCIPETSDENKENAVNDTAGGNNEGSIITTVTVPKDGEGNKQNDKTTKTIKDSAASSVLLKACPSRPQQRGGGFVVKDFISITKRKRRFFVDGHDERPNVVFHGNKFCTNQP
jgi:hypothetical protein